MAGALAAEPAALLTTTLYCPELVVCTLAKLNTELVAPDNGELPFSHW